MKSSVSKRFVSLAVVLTMLVLPLLVQGQTRRKPRLRRRTVVHRTTPGTTTEATPVGPLVPIGTNLKIRVEETLSSKDSRVGDRFTATALDPVRFNEAKVTGHISSIQKSGKVKGRTSMNLAFNSIELPDGRRGPLHGYVTRVYGGGSSQSGQRRRRRVGQPDESGSKTRRYRRGSRSDSWRHCRRRQRRGDWFDTGRRRRRGLARRAGKQRVEDRGRNRDACARYALMLS